MSSITERVREAYASVAKGESGGKGSCCCGTDARKYAKSLGYSDEELNTIPQEANLAVSCGNPTAIANLKEGETVMDLGSGAGFDCFLAADKVGLTGKVIGVDMTHEMLYKAREIAAREKIQNVDFRLGEIENLPVADNTVDVVISNCVINLSADKKRVYQEIARVLKPGGRTAISDVAILRNLPAKVRESLEAYVGCIAGALHIDEYKAITQEAGFLDVNISMSHNSFAESYDRSDPRIRDVIDSLEEGLTMRDYIASIYIELIK